METVREAQILQAQREQEQESLQRQILQAQDSQVLLSNPTLAAWWADMEAQCVSEIEDRGFADPNIRARCVDIITLLRKMKKSLEFYVENGYYAKEQLDALLEVKSKKLGGLFG